MKTEPFDRLSGVPGGRGFSLIEILVAFTVMTFVVGVLFQVFSTGLRTAVVAEEYSEGTRIAESLLEEAAGIRSLERGEQSGRVEDSPYEWHIRVAPFSVPGLPNDDYGAFEPVSISVRVHWASGVRGRQVELHTVRLQSRL